MWLRLKMAIKNSSRNRRRSLLNICMVAGAVSAIIVFEGFTYSMVQGLKETTVQTQTGHLQIALPSYWDRSADKPKDNLIRESKRLEKMIEGDARVKYAVGRLEFFGLVSLGNKSISAHGITVDPSKEGGRLRHFRFVKGYPLTTKKAFQIALGYGLANRMHAKPKDRVSILTQTYDGVINAVDAEVAGIFNTGISEFDEVSFLIPLKTAQRLLDTTGVEQIVVGLKDTEKTNQVQEGLTRKVASIDPFLKIKNWEAVATLYRQVAMFNGVQNRVVQFILMSLVLLSILNTVGMSIFERTGEIGTIRALGERRSMVVLQFLLEGIVLGVSGVAVGILWGFLWAKGFNALHIPMTLPGASMPIYIQIVMVSDAIKMGALLGLVTTIVAAVIPAVRASKLNITEALRHNI